MCTFKVHSMYRTTTCLATLGLGVLLNAIALGSANWSFGRGNTTKGLYTYCYEDLCFNIPDDQVSGAHKACRFFAVNGQTFALLAMLAAPAHIVETFLIISCGKTIHWMFGMASLGLGIVAGVSNGLALLVWAIGVHDIEGFDIGQGMIYMLLSAFLIPVGALGSHHTGQKQYKDKE